MGAISNENLRLCKEAKKRVNQTKNNNKTIKSNKNNVCEQAAQKRLANKVAMQLLLAQLLNSIPSNSNLEINGIIEKLKQIRKEVVKNEKALKLVNMSINEATAIKKSLSR